MRELAFYIQKCRSKHCFLCIKKALTDLFFRNILIVALLEPIVVVALQYLVSGMCFIIAASFVCVTRLNKL